MGHRDLNNPFPKNRGILSIYCWLSVYLALRACSYRDIVSFQLRGSGSNATSVILPIPFLCIKTLGLFPATGSPRCGTHGVVLGVATPVLSRHHLFPAAGLRLQCDIGDLHHPFPKHRDPRTLSSVMSGTLHYGTLGVIAHQTMINYLIMDYQRSPPNG